LSAHPTTQAVLKQLSDRDLVNYCKISISLAIAQERLKIMPVISMFYGIVVLMYYFDNQKHHLPHIHVKYQDDEAAISIPAGELLEGELRKAKLKLVQAWIEIHQDELMANWELAIEGQQVFKIDPLR
jgi:uncharacterized membrane protein YcaP (DUF421 family)